MSGRIDATVIQYAHQYWKNVEKTPPTRRAALEPTAECLFTADSKSNLDTSLYLSLLRLSVLTPSISYAPQWRSTAALQSLPPSTLRNVHPITRAIVVAPPMSRSELRLASAYLTTYADDEKAGPDEEHALGSHSSRLEAGRLRVLAPDPDMGASSPSGG
ncbi:hypothetical protein DICSQDRAFT_171963 [Dichomitus squalens LYAD-421 SS1]|uniref:Uncharacterized protein n=1 Tax=Dichomitus squalens (strain LYAD-421) TaxID=732165 RepID=R7STL1_DICSQ|nr:uncharacterized protein DICSQDRAFT_171963 [Dichomitus squalens LYAD-421 SS1]EJF59564.1 hypothetical protein DICSQDRAFT_171963 [Dichomitus squalens LYAD-421 SS1]